MFVLLRDQAYFRALFFSGDGPVDLSQVKTPEILRFPNNDGLLLMMFGEKLCVMVQGAFLPYVAVTIPMCVLLKLLIFM